MAATAATGGTRPPAVGTGQRRPSTRRHRTGGDAPGGAPAASDISPDTAVLGGGARVCSSGPGNGNAGERLRGD